MTWLLLATGCDLSQLDDLTNRLVGEGLVVGVQAPTDDRIDLGDIGYEPGATATMFLAEAAIVDDLEKLPVSGATVTASDGPTSVNLGEQAGTGAYVSLPGSGLAYTAGNTMTVTVEVGKNVGTGSIVLPEGADLTIDELHTANEPLDLDLTGKGFTGTLIVVVDTLSGDVTYSNEPKDIRAVYELARGSTEVTSVTIPGDAFAGETVYALGFAGLNHTSSGDFDGMNSLLSSILAGQMEFHPVVTAPLP